MFADTSEWLTPTGISTIVLLLTTVLGFVATLLERAGKKDWAEKARAAQAQTATVSKVAGVVVKGLELSKTKGLDVATVNAVLETIRAESEKAGTEGVLKPIVQEVRAGVTPEAAVRLATARLEPRRVS